MTKGTRINARLSPALAARVARVRARTNKSTTAILVDALDRYCADLEDKSGDPAETLERAGFIGNFAGPKDLSGRYKARLTAGLLKKA